MIWFLCSLEILLVFFPLIHLIKFILKSKMQLTLIWGDIKAIDKSTMKREVCHGHKALNFMISIYLNDMSLFD